MDKQAIYESGLIKPIVKWGRITNLLACALSFAPALYLMIVYGAHPPIGAVIAASISVIVGFSGSLWIVEPISYYPILGIPGTYMSFLSGNISNLRVPCSSVAQEAAEVEEGSTEGSIVAVLGIGASIIVNLIVMVIGVFVGSQLLNAFPPVVQTAFSSYILPAVFGGVFAQFALKNIKLAAIALILTCVVQALHLSSAVGLPISIFVTIFIGIMIAKGSHKKDASEGSGQDGAVL